MRSMTRVAAAVALTGIVALAGCASGTGSPTDGASTPRHEIAPSGDAVTIEPRSGLKGATTYENDVFTIEVPAGMTAKEFELGTAGLEVDITADGAPRASVVVTMTPQEGANDDAVDAAAKVAGAELGASGVVTGIVSRPAIWEGLAYAVQTTFTLKVDVGGTEQVMDGILVDTRNESRTRLVSVSAEAPAGQLSSSVAYDVLRTLRLKG